MTYQICSKITFKTFSQISCLVVRCGSEILQIKIHMHSTVDYTYLDIDTLKDVTKDTDTHILSDPGTLLSEQ